MNNVVEKVDAPTQENEIFKKMFGEIDKKFIEWWIRVDVRIKKFMRNLKEKDAQVEEYIHNLKANLNHILCTYKPNQVDASSKWTKSQSGKGRWGSQFDAINTNKYSGT